MKNPPKKGGFFSGLKNKEAKKNELGVGKGGIKSFTCPNSQLDR
jgi:hypothetical protein